jgi:hypothetical protein
MTVATPGPGTYEAPPKLGSDGPAYSMGARLPPSYRLTSEPNDFL